MASPVNALRKSTAEALAKHAPFDGLEAGLLEEMAGRLTVAYYPAGKEIVGPGAGIVESLYIVKKGGVRAGATEHAAGSDVVLGPGECFPVGALTGRRATAYTYRALEDTFCWELAAGDFHSLLDRSAHFRRFCTDYLSALVEKSHRARRTEAVEALSGDAGLLAPLRSVVARDPVSCGPDTPVSEVVRVMHSARIGSMVVVDPHRIPVGIFTTPDVLGRVTLAQAPMDTPIGRLMTPDPVRLEEEAPLADAALEMARHGIRHVVVTRDGRLSGVVSERDLFALQRVSLRGLSGRIRSADSVATLAQAAAETRRMAGQLLAQGVDAEHLTQMTSALNDAVTRRLLEIAAPRPQGLPGRWCWMALGSEGRMEQTLATDQDNALIFVTGSPVDGARSALLAFAAEVNSGLEACGFPLCKGGIMARNPRWCLSLDEWKAVFDDWIRNHSPEALMNAAIFFDFRPIGGDPALAGELRQAVLGRTQGHAAFGRAMADAAVRARPPLGLLDGFVPDDPDRHPGLIDLKAQGARLFVDAARVLSLAHGLALTGTAARLRAAGAQTVLPEKEAAASIGAFHFIQGLRLRRQYPGGDIAPGTENRIDPAGLNEVDRRILKAVFRQALLLQQRLRQDFLL